MTAYCPGCKRLLALDDMSPDTHLCTDCVQDEYTCNACAGRGRGPAYALTHACGTHQRGYTRRAWYEVAR